MCKYNSFVHIQPCTSLLHPIKPKHWIRKEEVTRHKFWGVASGTFRSNCQPQIMMSAQAVCQRTELQFGKCCRLVAIFRNSNLKIVNGEGNATQSSVLTWRIPRTVKPGGFESKGHKESDTTEKLTHPHRKMGFPGVSNWKGMGLQSGRAGFHTWVRKIPWRRGSATHSNILAWRIPWTEEPGGLRYMGLQRIEDN